MRDNPRSRRKSEDCLSSTTIAGKAGSCIEIPPDPQPITVQVRHSQVYQIKDIKD